MKYIFTLCICCSSLLAFGQKHSLSFYANALHNFIYVDKDSDREESITRPLHVLPSYGLEYNTMNANKKIGLQASLNVVSDGIKLRRRKTYVNNNGTIVINRRGRSTSGSSPSLRVGLFRNLKAFRMATGLQLRYIPNNNSFTNRFAPNVNNGESVSLIWGKTYFFSFNVHSSLYLNVDYKLFTTGRSDIRLNFIGNIGLYPLYKTTSLIENFIENETRRIIHSNYGSYIGIGFKLVRSTDDKFKEIFNFKWN